MKHRTAPWLALIMLTLSVAACGTRQPVYNVENMPVPASTHKLSATEVGTTIQRVAHTRGWVLRPVAPGEFQGTLAWKDHEATARILYTANSYSITLINSPNLEQEDGKIHRKYNARVLQLKQEIDRSLAQEAM